jgi:short-subunit dehydrogenase
MQDKGIRTTIVCPGRVRTNISFHALDKNGNPHGKLDAGQANGITAEQTAKEILRAVMKNKREVLIGGKELIMAHLKRYFPGVFYRLVTRIKPT